jgi:hypothetical protein
MTKQNIDTQIDLIKKVKRIMDALQVTPINWEMDITKMNFSKLRSPVSFGRTQKTMRIEKINPMITENPYYDENNKELFSNNDTPLMMDLAELVISGSKIIPPIYCETHKVIDGEKVFVEKASLLDGSHRLRLATYMGLTEIPIIVFDRVLEYCFSVDKWVFELNGDVLNIKPIFGDSDYVFNIGANHGCYIDEMKTDYLTIFEG